MLSTRWGEYPKCSGVLAQASVCLSVCGKAVAVGVYDKKKFFALTHKNHPDGFTARFFFVFLFFFFLRRNEAFGEASRWWSGRWWSDGGGSGGPPPGIPLSLPRVSAGRRALYITRRGEYRKCSGVLALASVSVCLWQSPW